MKKIFYLLVIALIFNACNTDKKKKNSTIDEHSAEYSLDYEGIYKGTYPCADCSGIQVSLTLNTNKTFVYEMIYLDKKNEHFVYKGNYSVKENILTIKENDKPTYFFIGENTLTLLDKDLKPNTGKLANYYKLKKQDNKNKDVTVNTSNIKNTDTNMFPKAKQDEVKHIIDLPILKDEQNFKVEVFITKTMEVDCNYHSLQGSLLEKNLSGWGYNYYIFQTNGKVTSTLMACPDNSLTKKDIASESKLLNYNSKLPIVIYTPKEYTAKYKIWKVLPEEHTAKQSNVSE